ncbi:MAG: threonine--tRNA ligase [Candidatus Binatia bacterium]
MSEEITVTVAGREPVRVARGTTVREALGQSLGEAARRAVAAVLRDSSDGQDACNGNSAVDLHLPLESDCDIEPIEASRKEALDVIRHSAAHLLAQAVKRLYPEAQVTIGPVIQDGFFYDFKYDAGFTPDDLEKIEAEMKKIVAEKLEITREVVSRQQAVELFEAMGEHFKVEIVRDLPDEPITVYRQGDFVDLCRGPHVPSTSVLKAVKLLSVAGAYWRGDENNPMLQRIYGTAFADPKALKQHLAHLEEARKRDHRRLGKELGLFSFHKEAPATPFFLPDGTIVYNLLVDYIRALYEKYDYSEVITPQILDVDLWHRSGHYDHYKDNMYFTEIDEREFAVKPMNCPTHCLIYGEDIRSYRDLPIRFADFGRLHRFERSGVVHGLTRVRSFSQDDAHIYCMPEQIQAEIRAVIEMISSTHKAFGFEETRVYLSTRPENSIGELQVWERAEATLKEALEAESIDYEINEGDGAFYGPKIDFCVLDAMKREWQLSTAQLDFSMPERFGLTYVDSTGGQARPVMIHRAILGSLERFIGILIEHTGGALPLWLAPCQVRLVTVTDRQNEYAAAAEKTLRARGIRARADLRNEKLGFKIREARQAKVPVTAVIGDREVEDGTVAPRLRDGSQPGAMPLDAFTDWIAERAVPDNGGVP